MNKEIDLCAFLLYLTSSTIDIPITSIYAI